MHIKTLNYPLPKGQQADTPALVELYVNAHNSLKHQVNQAEDAARLSRALLLSGSVNAHNFLSTMIIILYFAWHFSLCGGFTLYSLHCAIFFCILSTSNHTVNEIFTGQ
jgi:hypothetical protein